MLSKNATITQKRTVSVVFNIPHRDTVGEYLGCLAFQGRANLSTFKEILIKATARMEAWKANSLSKAGRVVLFQSNLESLPTHTMQCFELPKKTTSLLDHVNRTFLWKKSGSDQGLPMVAWDKVCQPKNLGGLGVRKIEAVNLAFQAKLAWKILIGAEGL